MHASRRHPRRAAAAIVLALLAAAPAAAAPPPRATDGTIARIAGTTPGFAGDGGPATAALVNTPRDLAFLPDGSLLIADFANDRIRRVAPNGTITTAAGGAARGLAGDGGPAGSAQLDQPRGVTPLASGAYLIADTFNHRLRRVGANGTITTFAGTTQGLAGDSGPATQAKLNLPSSTVVAPDGSIYVADTGNNRIRRIAPNGTISTVAGTTAGFSGDGGPATAAQLNAPRDVAVATDGALLIADTGNDRIRRVAPDGTISTVLGDNAGFGGDGFLARDAQVRAPFSVAALRNGGFLVADTANNRVRRVTPLGTVFTVAGSDLGSTGDGGPAKGALLNQPGAVATAPGGGFVVADTGNARIRRVSDVGAVPIAVTGRTVGIAPDADGVSVLPSGAQDLLPLLEEDLVATGTLVDATTGRVDVALTDDAAGTQQTATLDDGPFVVTQTPTSDPVTTFKLPSVKDCAARRRADAGSPRAERRKKKRHGSRRGLWVTERGGRWRTSTGSVTAAAVGTIWHTTLSCDGTRITVREGIVSVRDKLHRKTIVVRAGQSVLVRTPPKYAGL